MKKNADTLVRLGSAALMALFLLPSFAAAQDYDDPPSRVARLSYMQGYVSFSPAGTQDWVDAFVNRPLTTGDALWSDSRSRVALHIGSASIHLSEYTGISFLNLTDNAVQIQVNSGTLRIRVKRLRDYENFEIDTPNLAFTIVSPGIYKINVSQDGYTTIIEDRRGDGEVTGGGLAYDVHSGDVGRFTGTDQLRADMGYLGDDEDDFERWSEQRDHHEDISISARYVSDEAIGYDDLDDNGGWRPVPNYGMVWFPHTATIGWAPYHYGHWAYVAPWGYTWVDDAAWGFAPFHYGRWIAVDGTWGWVPCAPRPPGGGGVYLSPVYAPALVAWIGGPHFGVGLAVGGVGVGWFPLGPREVYVPSYPVSRNYVTNVNVSNTTVNTTVVNNYYTNVVINKTVNITNVTYVNQRVPGAVVATSQQAFSSGQPVAHNAVQINASEVASAPVNAMTPPAVPQVQAVTGGRPAAKAKPPAAVLARPVVAKTAPPPPPPSFTQRQAAIQSNGGRPLSVAQVRQIAPARTQTAAAPQVRVAPPATKVVTPPRNTEAGKQNQPQNQNYPNRPGTAAGPVPNNGNKPASQPSPQPAANINQPHPPTAHPANEQLEQQHQQQLADLHKQQDLERQQVEDQQKKEAQQLQQQKAEAAKQQQAQQQALQQQKADAVKQQQVLQQQKAEAAKQQQAEQQLQQQHQQQLQAMQQKHQQQQAQLQAKQEEEHRQQQPAAKPKPEPKEKEKEPPH
jgi:hypothetical protein